MKKNIEFAKNIIDKLIGLRAKNVALGHGTFITFEFGKMITITKNTYKGLKTYTHGEWHLWVYMCSWRIDKNDKPLAGSHDSAEHMKKTIELLNNKKIIKYEILDKALDAKLYFEDNLSLSLFNCNTDDATHWLLFTPDHNVLKIGPVDKVIYKPASSTEEKK